MYDRHRLFQYGRDNADDDTRVVAHRSLKMNQVSSMCERLQEVRERNLCTKLHERLKFLKEVFHSILHDVLIVSLIVITWYLEC